MVAHGQRLLFVRRGGGGRFTDRRCRGRRPRRPAEVSGGGRYTGGMNPSPTGGTLAAGGREVAERKINGRQWQGCGPGMPGPYGLPQMGYGREGRGRAAARPFAVGGWRRKARQSPSGLASSASSPLRGAPFARAKPAREASLVKGRCRAQARRRDSWPSAGVTGGHARPVGIPQSANAASPL